MSQKPSIGRTVHYVLTEGPTAGQHRPAIIVDVHPDGAVDLQIFTTPVEKRWPIQWQSAANQSEDVKLPGTWHWPERD